MAVSEIKKREKPEVHRASYFWALWVGPDVSESENQALSYSALSEMSRMRSKIIQAQSAGECFDIMWDLRHPFGFPLF